MSTKLVSAISAACMVASTSQTLRGAASPASEAALTVKSNIPTLRDQSRQASEAAFNDTSSAIAPSTDDSVYESSEEALEEASPAPTAARMRFSLRAAASALVVALFANPGLSMALEADQFGFECRVNIALECKNQARMVEAVKLYNSCSEGFGDYLKECTSLPEFEENKRKMESLVTLFDYCNEETASELPASIDVNICWELSSEDGASKTADYSMFSGMNRRLKVVHDKIDRDCEDE